MPPPVNEHPQHLACSSHNNFPHPGKVILDATAAVSVAPDVAGVGPWLATFSYLVNPERVISFHLATAATLD